MTLNFKKLSNRATAPTTATVGSAGYDLYAALEKDIIILPGKCALIPTDIAMEIPEGYFGAMYPRSGLSTKRGLRLANCVGVIDQDYRGAVGVPVYNDSEKVQVVKPHDRIAQMIFQPYQKMELNEVDELDATDRGQGGFGSTGQ